VRKFDFDKPWDEGINLPIAETPLLIFHCPSSRKDFLGKTDYSGISGSLRFLGGSRNGVLLLSPDSQAKSGVSVASITDGLSHTIFVAESSELPAETGGYWAAGENCITHEEGGVNNDEPETEISSDHWGGANVGFCSGSIMFVSTEVEVDIVAGLCTRAGSESTGDF